MNQKYELTFDDSDVPAHYGWKVASHLERLEKQYLSLRANKSVSTVLSVDKNSKIQPDRIRQIVQRLDDQGRWLSIHSNEMLVGQPKLKAGEPYISSQLFSTNLETLSEFVKN